MRKFILFLTLSCCTVFAVAQTPKFASKAAKSMLLVRCYDDADSLIATTNAIVYDKGLALSDFQSFRGARRAVVVDVKGKEYPVERILGCSSLYDVVRFSVKNCKTKPLSVAAQQAVQGEQLFVQPQQGAPLTSLRTTTVAQLQQFQEQYAYYTLPVALPDSFVSCPVFNAEGEVVALSQRTGSVQDTLSYAIDIQYILQLQVTAMMSNGDLVRELYIPMALPQRETEATTFLYLAAALDSVRYATYLKDFITAFPTSATGYKLQAAFLTQHQQYAEADATWKEGISASSSTSELYYSQAQCYYNVVKSTPNHPEHWNLTTALEAIQKAIQIDSLPVYTFLEAQILYSNNDFATAGERFQALTTTNLRSSDMFLYAAQCCLMQNDTLATLALQDSAVACYTKPYMPAAARPLLIRANTLISMGRYAEGVRDLNEYERLERKNLSENFYYKRYQAEMQCRMYQQALDDIETACNMNAQEPLFQAERAVVYYRFGEIEEATTAARAALALYEEFPDAHRILAICLQQQGKVEESRQHLQRAADLGDELAKTMLKE